MTRLKPDLPDETKRLRALDSYAVLDTAPEPGFDDIVHLACRLCATPVALISLVDRDRQWFKARVNFPPCETDLGSSVCRFALDEPDVLVIPDLTADPRTAGNPLVTGEPLIRFYAGAPLRTPDGDVLGSLCVIDKQARPAGLTADQADDLGRLARQVMSQLELRRSLIARDGLLQAHERAIEVRRIFADTLTAITAADGDLDTILDALVTGAMRAVPAADGGVIQLIDGDELEFHAVRGSLVPQRGLRIPLHDSVAGRCALNRTALLVPDALAEPTAKPHMVTRLDYRSGLFAPVTRGEKVLAVLKLQSRVPGAFTEDDLELARLFAGAATNGLTEANEVAAQRAVQASEARHRAIFESAIDYAIIVLDRDGRVTNWNSGAENVLGWSAADMIGKPADVFFTPEDRVDEVPAKEMHSALAEGRGIDERWHLRKTGERFWANGEMMTLRDDAGAAIGFVKILRDRTEQREAAQRLETREAQLRLAQEAGRTGSFVIDIVNNTISASPEFCRVFGLPVRDDYAPEDFTDLVVPEDQEATSSKARRSTGEMPLSTEYRVRRADDGQIVWVARRAEFIRDASGKPLFLLGTVRDDTESRKLIERQAALVELGDLLRELDDPAAMSFVAAEVMGRTVGVSRAGYGTVDIAGETVTIERDWTRPGVSSIAGRYSFEAFGSYIEQLRRGHDVCIDDVTLDARTADRADAFREIDTRALMNVPLMEHGRLVAIFFLHDAAVRHWSPEKLVFIRSVTDRTRAAIERVRAEQRQTLLNQELNHRLKNTLSMVQAIATQTMRNAKDLKSAAETLSSRLVALGGAHDVLLSGHREAAPVRALILGAVGVHDRQSGRFRLSGPDMEVGSRAALSLSLMLHELATNAVKYGALSAPGGNVDVRWSVEDTGADATFHFDWQERGGPPVVAPARRGFGSRLIERGLAGQIGGTVELTFDPAGVSCRLHAPLVAFQAEAVHPERK